MHVITFFSFLYARHVVCYQVWFRDLFFLYSTTCCRLLNFIIIISSSLWIQCGTRASPNLLHSSLSDACLLQVTQAKLQISSLHLVLCLPCLLLPSLGCHSVTLIVHVLSLCLMTCPAHVTFFSFDHAQNVLNFGLFPNTLPVPSTSSWTWISCLDVFDIYLKKKMSVTRCTRFN